MLKLKNKRFKLVSFTLVMAMLICSLFTMSISAVEEIAEIENDNAFVISIVPVWSENGEFIGVTTTATCTHPQNKWYDFIEFHTKDKNGDCRYKVGIRCGACGTNITYGDGVGNPCPGYPHPN